MSALQFIIGKLILYLPWILLFAAIVSTIFVYLPTHENNGFRVTLTYIGHLLVIGLGWLLGKWYGIILISIPILIFYYYMLFHLAMVVVPPGDPDSWPERLKRYSVFAWYQWGVQCPLWVVSDPVGNHVETRIQGDLFGGFSPGIVWARSHQAVVLTTGLSFSGVRQAGIIFTKPYERPCDVVDLRTHLRSSLIEVVSSDGIPYTARMFAAFGIDKDKWDRNLYHQILAGNPLLKNAREPDCTRGVYHFSRARMHALLSTVGIGLSDRDARSKTIEWYESAYFYIEKTVREILSQKRLDELWKPPGDRENANAMDEIAQTIKNGCSIQLKQRGIHLYSCRVVDFEFVKKENEEKKKEYEQEKKDKVKQKQMTVWSADWKREAEQARAEGKAEADLLMQEARAYAYTNLLTAIAEGLQETRLLDPHLPRYVIAVRFISAMERLIEEQPAVEDIKEARASLDGVKKMIPLIGDRE